MKSQGVFICFKALGFAQTHSLFEKSEAKTFVKNRIEYAVFIRDKGETLAGELGAEPPRY